MITTPTDWNKELYSWNSDDAEIVLLEKAEQSGRTTMEDIADALDEYKRLWQAGIASKGETMTLARAFPDAPEYTEAVGTFGDTEPLIVGGPASVELIDREGHMITTNALQRAFKRYMANFRTRNAMVLHSDVQVGWALPAYINKSGQIFKSGVDTKGLYFICEIRDDTKIAGRVQEQINQGKLKSYSIAGSATKTQNMQKGLMPYMQVDEMELAEVTVCEKGVNQGAGFDLLKSTYKPTDSCIDGSCLIKLEKREEELHDPINLEVELMEKENGDIDFVKSFESWRKIQKSEDCPCNEFGHDSIETFTDILAKAKDPLHDKSFTTLQNFEGRTEEHHQLLREYGFPSEQPAEGSRYTPVVEVDTNDWGIPINNRPPWIVNEAGESLGDRLDEDSPDYSKSAQAKAKEAAERAGHPWYSAEIPVTKQFFNYMDDVTGVEVPADFQRQAYSQPYDGEKNLPITSWLKDTSTDDEEKPAHQFEKSCGCETCFQKLTDYRGTFQKTVENPFAVATAQAKEKGHEDFSEGSKGDKLKDKIAEALKR